MGSEAALVPLAEYQRRWVLDRSRFKLGVITRQGGKSFASALEVALDCYDRPGAMWVLLSAGERQSKELMGKVRMHAQAIGSVVQAMESEFITEDGAKYKQLEIVFPNGSRVVGLPANPDTARGWSAHILLDEFALHKDSREIWKAMFPTVTRGYRVIVISTFKGKSNKFYELWSSAPTLQRFIGKDHVFIGQRGGWSKHFVSIHDAVTMGLELHDDEGQPCEPEDLRLALNDQDAWEEEYECQASDEAHAYLAHDLISRAEDGAIDMFPTWAAALIEANEDIPLQDKETFVMAQVKFSGDLYLGMDIGRKKDLSVLWLDEFQPGGNLRCQAVIELRRKPFRIQYRVLRGILSLPWFRRACIDETGIGMQMAEDATIDYGEHLVEGVPFTPANKEALAGGLKNSLDDGRRQIPADSTIHASFHSVKRYPTTTKHFRFDADKSEATGHADHFWAAALSEQAASSPVSGPVEYTSAVRSRWGEDAGRGAY